MGLRRLGDGALLMWWAWAAFLATIMVLERAHSLSPVLLAWSHRELRAIILREWRAYIVAPAIVVIGALLAPADQVRDFYWTWNAYHFGMQNFGLLQLHREGGSVDRRVYDGLICLAIAAGGIGALQWYFPRDSLPGLLILVAFSLDHWLCDLALSSRVSRWQFGFLAVTIAFGAVWLVLRQGPLSVHNVSQIATVAYAMGMVHFIYSARVWQLSDPKIRAAIGTSLVSPARSC